MLIIMEQNGKRRKRRTVQHHIIQYNHNVIKSTIRIDTDLLIILINIIYDETQQSRLHNAITAVESK